MTRATAAGAAGRERNVKGLANANPTAATCLCWRGPCRFAARSAGDRARGLSCLSCPSWCEARSSLRAVRSTPGHDRSVTRGRSSRFQPPLRALRALRSIRGHDRSVTRGSPRGSSGFSPADISVTAKQVSEIGSSELMSQIGPRDRRILSTAGKPFPGRLHQLRRNPWVRNGLIEGNF